MTSSSFVLIIYIITSYGAVDTQRETGFSSRESCASEAVARIETQQQFHPNAWIKWECQHDSGQ